MAMVLSGKGFDDSKQDEVSNLIAAHSETLELAKSVSKEEEHQS